MEKKVLFVDTVHPALEQMLSSHGWHCVNGTMWQLDKILETLHLYTGVVIRSRFRIDDSFVSKATSLKFIARAGAGMENIDTVAAGKAGIICINAPEGNRNAVAEHALGMLLALMNNLVNADAQVRKGIWKREENRGNEIAGKTAAVIGFGNTGSSFGKKLAALDVNVLAYDPYITINTNNWKNIKQTDLDSIYAQADIISFHVPLTPETANMVNMDFLNNFKKPVYLINTSRGGILSVNDLNKALEIKKVKGAALDVLEFEHLSFENLPFEKIPGAFTRLCSFSNVILSPHVAGWTIESHRMISEVLGQKIINTFSG